MRYCHTCKVEYRVDEINYCLNDGTLLIDKDTEETVLIPETQTPYDAKAAADALTKLRYTYAVDEKLVSLYMFDVYYELSLDARFTRLVDSIFRINPENCLIFVNRLVKRAELHDANQRPNPDVSIIWQALDGNNADRTREILEDNGLL